MPMTINTKGLYRGLCRLILQMRSRLNRSSHPIRLSLDHRSESDRDLRFEMSLLPTLLIKDSSRSSVLCHILTREFVTQVMLTILTYWIRYSFFEGCVCTIRSLASQNAYTLGSCRIGTYQFSTLSTIISTRFGPEAVSF